MNKIFHSFHPHNYLLAIIIGFQVFRLLLIPFVGIMPQDAYYFYYGQHLDWSYFDHPGMIGYALRLSSELLGQRVWVLKLTDFTISSISLWMIHQLARKFLSAHRSLMVTFIFSAGVLWSMLSFNSTPDVPLVLFWTLSLFYYFKAVTENKWLFWILAGVCSGLAFDSKYTALLLPFGIIAFTLFSPAHRKQLIQPKLWMSLLIFVLVSFPVIYWNIQHDFVSFGFQTAERSTGMKLSEDSPRLFIGFLISQMVLIYPLIFILLSILIYKYTKRLLFKFKLPALKPLFLLSFSIPTFVGFFLLAPMYWIKINWLIPSYISGVILLAMFYKNKWFKTHLYTSIIVQLIIAITVIIQPFPIKSDDTFIGWKPLSNQVEQLSTTYPDDFIFSLDNYKTTAVLQFYLNEKIIYNRNIVGLPSLQYSITQQTDTLIGRNALLIDSEPSFSSDTIQQEYPKILENYFDRVELLQPILIKNNRGITVRKFNVYRCYNYLTTRGYR